MLNMRDDWRSAGFGLYLHWPYCQSKCPYCDFNSHVAGSVDQGRWQRAFLLELDRTGAETQGRILQSVFFGGGTPSLMEPGVVAAILERIGKTWTLANDFEVTLEANPGSVDAGRFASYAEAGVNRLSLGVQALEDQALRRLGRLHTASDALRALTIAQRAFARVSFDLIYARQDQTLENWSRELDQALSVQTDHLSLYQLTIEDGTAFGARAAAGGLAGLPGEELAADMYDLTQERCARAGLPGYEVSNHASQGAECRHNLIYWRGGDYAGIGPGAHGRLTLAAGRMATESRRDPAEWLRAVESLGSGELPRSALSASDRASEYLMMSLRLSEGGDLHRFETLAGSPLDAMALEELSHLGLVRVDSGRVRTTGSGRLVLNAVLGRLLAA